MRDEQRETADQEQPLSDEAIAELKAKHGPKLVAQTTEDGEVLVFKKPSKLTYEEYQGRVVSESEKFGVAIREYCRRCFVYPEDSKGKPDLRKFDEACEAAPALPSRVGPQLSALAGTKLADPKVL